jgi:hypothetical protein
MEGGNWGWPICEDKGTGVGRLAWELCEHCPGTKQCAKSEGPVRETMHANPILGVHTAARGHIRRCMGAL